MIGSILIFSSIAFIVVWLYCAIIVGKDDK